MPCKPRLIDLWRKHSVQDEEQLRYSLVHCTKWVHQRWLVRPVISYLYGKMTQLRHLLLVKVREINISSSVNLNDAWSVPDKLFGLKLLIRFHPPKMDDHLIFILVNLERMLFGWCSRVLAAEVTQSWNWKHSYSPDSKTTFSDWWTYFKPQNIRRSRILQYTLFCRSKCPIKLSQWRNNW